MKYTNPERILLALEEIESVCNVQRDADEIIHHILKKMLELFSCDRAWLLHPCNPDLPSFEIPYQSASPSFPTPKAMTETIPMTSDMAAYCRRALVNIGSPQTDLPLDQEKTNAIALQFDITSLMFMALKLQNDEAWMLGLHHCALKHQWTNDERRLFTFIGQRITQFIENAILTKQKAENEKEHRLLFKAIQESEERFRNLMENVDAVAVQGYNLDGTTQYWNKASERLYGYTQQEAIGRKLTDLIIPPEMRPVVAEAMRRMTESGESIPTEELLLQHKDGSPIPVLSHHTIVKVPGRDHELFCLDIDLTALKQAEEERGKLLGQLNQAQKMEAIGRLAGGVAHDFNNMLGVILGYVEIAFGKVDRREALYFDLEKIQKAALQSVDLTKQLLTFARKQIITPKVLDLNNSVENMITMLRRLIGEDIELQWLPADQLWPVKVDPTQIDQILVNLCVNARDAIGGVGKITIETHMKTFDQLHCKKQSECITGDYVALSVTDNGCGMDKETLDNLFEPFFTTKKIGKGTGLGLAIVYGIVKQNEGFIDVYSEPGQGTHFNLYLPRVHADISEKNQEKPRGEKPIQTGNETILVVEDEPAILEMVTVMLEERGYFVLSAATPLDAIKIAEACEGNIDLLMTDVIMPEMNGRDLAETLRETFPTIKLLFMSGYSANVITSKGVLDEGIAFLQKPFSTQEAAYKIREVLDGN